MKRNEIIEIFPADLMAKSLKMKHDGYRIVQICATRTQEGYELTYSFALEYDLVGLRFRMGTDDEITTISTIFSPAFLYENEIRDLFGVKIQMINIDYKGNLYRLNTKTPFKE
jgi:ech hydrogenase subunit D